MNGNFNSVIGTYYKDKYGATKKIYKLTSLHSDQGEYSLIDQYGVTYIATQKDLDTRLEIVNPKVARILYDK